jgi:hypothetical protein
MLYDLSSPLSPNLCASPFTTIPNTYSHASTPKYRAGMCSNPILRDKVAKPSCHLESPRNISIRGGNSFRPGTKIDTLTIRLEIPLWKVGSLQRYRRRNKTGSAVRVCTAFDRVVTPFIRVSVFCTPDRLNKCVNTIALAHSDKDPSLLDNPPQICQQVF